MKQTKQKGTLLLTSEDALAWTKLRKLGPEVLERILMDTVNDIVSSYFFLLLKDFYGTLLWNFLVTEYAAQSGSHNTLKKTTETTKERDFVSIFHLLS